MTKFIPASLRGLVCTIALLFVHYGAFASHIVGCDLFYTWISGNNYKVTVILYGNCGPSSASAFGLLPTSTPKVCIWDGGTYWNTITCTVNPPSTGVEITPVCPADSNASQCWIPSSTIPGIKKFVYTATVTLPYASHVWRFVYTGANVAVTSGRAASITNIAGAGGTTMQLIDTLDNAYPGIFSHNTSPLLTVVPTPFFCLNNTDCYNPGALDPDGDSLRFALVPPTNGSGSSGSAGGCAVGGPLGYVAGTSWPGQPLTGATPLQSVLAPPSFYFDGSTGQICFYPTVTQRSVVVYNIQEFRNDTFVGTCQREMTFVVLTCTNTAPTSAIASLSGVVFDDSTHYHICGNAGAFCVSYGATEPDTANHITLTVTGLTGGMTYTVTANGTNHPTVTICGNTATMTPGLYTFFLHMQDDNCPLSGVNIQAYSINIYPVPTIRDSIALAATCFRGAVVYFWPGGTGQPWTIDFFHGPSDTFLTVVDSVMFIDTLNPTVGFTDTAVIYTSVSHQCAAWIPIVIDPPPAILPTITFVNPSYCGATDGSITIGNLTPGVTDTVRYDFNGVPQPYLLATVNGAGEIYIPSLHAGTYSNFVVTYGFCHSDPLGPYVLVNPPFPIRTLSYTNPSRCGYCDGSITLYGLHPGQLDTIYYTYTPSGGTPLATSISYSIGADSMVLFNALCDGDTYTNFFARTDSTCVTATLLGVTMNGPDLRDSFDFRIDYGCHGDTVIFTNTNYSDSDKTLDYHWFFGDGYSDTAQNPNHIYINSQTDTAFIAKLYATNGRCIDSMSKLVKLLNYIDASYTFTPTPYVCQLTPVNFGNTSISLSPADSAATTYTWNFGNGTSSGFSPTNVYPTTGTYVVTLIETNFIPCSDTFTQTIVVDTISGIKLDATDTVLCRGKQVTFTATYADQGSTGNVWSITDGFTMLDVNPMVHAFDAAGQYIVSVGAKYRACPETTATKTITVYAYPDIYLGPDTSICPGSSSIILSDDRNGITPGATWTWNTGETGSQIVVTKPGYYYVDVTMNGCTTSDTVWVKKDCYMDLPNVFTPNGDGVNDYFFPRQLLTRGLTTFSMNIYNRWGQLVYETTSLDGRGWDGSFNDQPQPGGVYVYVIDATFKDGQIEHHQGNVTLLR